MNFPIDKFLNHNEILPYPYTLTLRVHISPDISFDISNSCFVLSNGASARVVRPVILQLAPGLI
jgi:hypothetical protein